MRRRIRRVIDQANFALFVWRLAPFAPLLNEQTISQKCHRTIEGHHRREAPDGELLADEVQLAELSTKVSRNAVIQISPAKMRACRSTLEALQSTSSVVRERMETAR
jgi:hypothetical protein